MHTAKHRAWTRKNWSKNQPSHHERTVMKKKCGKKCFLGENNTFPICLKNTCYQNKEGVLAAYKRAREWISLSKKSKQGKSSSYYKRISKRARNILKRTAKRRHH